MLAQSFKTAAELGVSDKQLTSLVTVLGMLERGEIPENLFDMHVVGDPACGTPGCLLGWAKSVGYPYKYEEAGALKHLFFPGMERAIIYKDGGDLRSPYDATRAEAAVALRSYLTTGEACWEEALS